MGLWIHRLKGQLKNRKFIFFMFLGIVVCMILCIEFLLLSYTLLKIIRYMILLAAMFIVAWIDQHERRIPNRILLVLLETRVVLLIVEWFVVPAMGMSLLISSLLGALIGGGMFLLAYFLSRGGVGMGDVKLLAVIGAYVGVGNIMALIFVTALISAFFSIAMLAMKKIKLKEEIPFAPFVLAGTVLMMALGM